MNKREEERLRKQQEKLEKEIARTEAMSVFEKEYSDHQAICGIDEVGRGPFAGPVVADLRGGRLFGAHQLSGGGVTVKHQRAHLDGTNGAAVDGGHRRDLGLALSGTGPAVVHRLQLQHHAALGQRIGRILGGCDGEASLLLAAAGELRAGRTGHRRSSRRHTWSRSCRTPRRSHDS